MFKKCVFVGMCVLVASACVAEKEFDPPTSNCQEAIQATTTFSALKSLYTGEVLQIQEDWILEGYVISSDRAGNFFKVLYLQESPSGASEGIRIEIDVRDSYLLFPEGSRVFIKLKGLYLGKSKAVFELGGTFSGFGAMAVGRLPALKVSEHIFTSCDPAAQIVPNVLSLEAVDTLYTNTLVQLQEVEFLESELDSTFAQEGKETARILINCLDSELRMISSGFADFQSVKLPQGNGTVSGILLRDNDEVFLAIRDMEDIDFSNERCEDVITEFSSQQIFISELADPDNNAGARFVELYNADTVPLDLNQWTLRRYTNANTEVSSSIDLSGLRIAAQGTLVISPNPEEFERIYGFPPDLGVSTNSPADSNGDDNLELVDPFGTIIDAFGIVGEDGSGTNHEFEDGKALRNPDILKANANYTFSEWTIYNDSGAAGTMNSPQNAPEDFNPGQRE